MIRLIIAASMLVSCAVRELPAQVPDEQLDSLVWWHIMRNAWLPPDSVPLNNDRGAISWAQSYRIQGGARYLRLAPNDSAQWRLLRRDVIAALGARDSERHVSDYHGISASVWSGTANRIPDGTRSAMLVENAWIASALVDAAITLTSGNGSDRALAGRCIAAAQSALHAFDGDLRTDERTGGENYVFPQDVPLRAWEHGRIVPMNFLAAAGYAWYLLGQAIGDSVAKFHAQRIALALTGQMWMDKGSLQWRYQTQSVIEDISHGGIVVTFLMHLEPEPRVQGSPVRQALASTLKRIFKETGDSIVVADHIDGSRTGEARLVGTFGQWAEVLRVACDEYPVVARAILRYQKRQGGQSFIGAAALLESAHGCPGANQDLINALSPSGVSVVGSVRHGR